MYLLIHFVSLLLIISCSSTNIEETLTTQSLLGETTAEHLQEKEKLAKDWQQLKIEQDKLEQEKKEMQSSNEGTDVFRLNVGGEIMMTTRHTLTRVAKCILATLFNGRWEHKLSVDIYGNIFLDFNPILFRHFLEQLRTLENTKSPVFYPPLSPSLVAPFEKMLRKLGFTSVLQSSDDVIGLNVGGELMITRQDTLTRVPQSKLAAIVLHSKLKNKDDSGYLILDQDPKLFRHLLKQLRGQKQTNISYFDAPSNEDRTSFNSMLKNLDLKQQFISTSINIPSNTKWKQNGITVAGGNERGNKLNQIAQPFGIYVDDDQTIYIADWLNDRIVSWKCDSKNGEIVAGGNEKGNRTDRLNYPTDVIVDKENDSLIICDRRNRRVMRWSRRNDTNGQTIISDIDCWGVTMDKNGDLYVSDDEKNEVRRWSRGKSVGTIVAGGNGKGDHLNQLNVPTFIFIDEDYSVYVSDCSNNRVMKWMPGAKEGIVVAGGKGRENSLTQLSCPQGLIVDQLGHIYVGDFYNNRVMRWYKGAKEGNILVGGNGYGEQSNQFRYLRGLSFDRQGNLYVADWANNRIQKFEIDSN